MVRALSPEQMVKALGLLTTQGGWDKEIRKAHAPASNVAAKAARGAMRSGGRQLARAARGVRSAPTRSQARLAVKPTAAVPYVLVATWGSLRRTGFYAQGKYAGATRQHPAWVGNSWQVATRGQGPYGINDGLAGGVDEIRAAYEKAVMDLLNRAFP